MRLNLQPAIEMEINPNGEYLVEEFSIIFAQNVFLAKYDNCNV